jgi:hypothetical protein
MICNGKLSKGRIKAKRIADKGRGERYKGGNFKIK